MKIKHLMAAMVSALALSTSASAGFFDFTLAPFVGAGIGKSQIDITCPASTSCDDKDTAYKLYGGLEMNEFISMEVGYVNLGEARVTGVPFGTVSYHGMTMQILGTYAINPSFTLLVRGGMNILNAEVNGTIAAPTNNSGDTDVAWSAGLGGQYNLTKSVGLRMEWERFFKVGDSTTTGEADVDMISAGLVYKF